MSGISSVLLQNPGKCVAQTSLQPFAASAAASDPRSGLRYKICVCDASASLIRNLDGTANLTTGGRNGPKGSKRLFSEATSKLQASKELVAWPACKFGTTWHDAYSLTATTPMSFRSRA